MRRMGEKPKKKNKCNYFVELRHWSKYFPKLKLKEENKKEASIAIRHASSNFVQDVE